MNFNRVEMEVSNWLQTEARIGKLFSFSPSANKAMLGQKLRSYDLISAKYRSTANAEERYTLAFVSQERRKIEKQLYPNLIVRLVRRLMIAPILSRKSAKNEIERKDMNTHAINENLRRLGFAELCEKVENKIMEGQEQFTVPISYFIDDRLRMDHQVSIARDGNGEYQVRGFEAALHDQKKPAEQKKQFFEQDASNSIDVNQAYHLLSGRALEKEGKWIQLDFNDRDEKGNFRMKDYRTGQQYDLGEKLKALPMNRLGIKEQEKLIDALKGGERQSVTFTIDGNEKRFFIEANPQFRTITVYDEHSKKITLGNKELKPNDLTVVHKVHEILDSTSNKRAGRKIK